MKLICEQTASRDSESCNTMVKIQNTSGIKAPLLTSTRLSVYLMLFATSWLHIVQRFAINLNIICMVVPQQQYVNITSNKPENYTHDFVNKSTKSQCDHSTREKKDFGYEGEFYWSRAQVGYILAGYFYGYIPMQLLAGWMADKFGVRHVLGTGTLIGGLLSLLIPVAARVHYGLLIAVRVLMGFTMGVIFPCINSSIGKWVPLSDRMTYLAVVFSGANGGSVIAYVLSGYLCHISWTLVLYILGCATIFWYIAYWFTVYSSPDEHPRISDNEKSYIRQNTIASKQGLQKKIKIPWKKILTSPPVLGLTVAHFTFAWNFYTVNVGIPLYMHDVLYFNIKDNGLLSSLPPLIKVVCGIGVALLVDYIHQNLIKLRHVMRKTCQTILCVLLIGPIIAVGFIGCEHRTYAVVLFCVIYLGTVFTRGGSSLIPSDIAPRIAGTVYGFTNFVAAFTGFIVPIAIGNLTATGSQAEWQRVFFLAGGIVFVGWLAFMVLVSTDKQPWAKGDSNIVETNIPEENCNTEPLAKTPEIQNEDHCSSSDVWLRHIDLEMKAINLQEKWVLQIC